MSETETTTAATNSEQRAERYRRQVLTIAMVEARVLRFLAILLPFPMGIFEELLNALVERYQPPPPPLVDRAREVTDALTKAGSLLDELQAEVAARAAVVESLEGKANEAEQRAEDAIRRAALREEQAKAVDAFLERAMQSRIADLEKKARRREWGLATIGSVATGLVCIVISHYAFGF